MSSSAACIDLTDEAPPKKQKVESSSSTAVATLPSTSHKQSAAPVPVTTALPKTTKTTKATKKDVPHVLIWICCHGKGQSKAWTNKALKVIGVYNSKLEAEQKKDEVMQQHDQYGHGDICVGGTWMDEIDLVIRPAGECTL